MNRLILSIVLAAHCAFSGLANAEDEVRQFYSEVLSLESKQVLTPDKPFTYSDPTHGAALRRLLEPARTQKIVAKYFEDIAARKSPPDIGRQLGPLLQRYETAFIANPPQFEAEYLDSLELMVELLKRSSIVSPIDVTPKSDSNLETVRKLALSMEGLMSSLKKGLANNVRDKIAKGIFSANAKVRAQELANRLDDGVAIPTPPVVAKQEPQLMTRALMDGRQTYNALCSACHTTGAAGAPRIGDAVAWGPRLKLGLPALLNSTVRGKGAMGPQSGGSLDPIELERAVVYLSNQSGGRFTEPVVPAGHLGTHTYRELPRLPAPVAQPFSYETSTQEERLSFGERVYAQNCAACHQKDGQGAGRVIPSLKNARTFSNNESVIRIILKGSPGTAMPAWRSALSNNEIAAVVNYMRDKFGNDLYEYVQPQDVMALR